MTAAPRSRAQRRRDTEHRLTHDIDVWVATASAEGAPYLAPVSFDWDGETLLMATPTDSPTGRNLAATQVVRLGLGDTRDVSMIDGEIEVLELEALPQERGGPVRRAHRLRPACAGHALPVVPHLPAPHPGLA